MYADAHTTDNQISRAMFKMLQAVGPSLGLTPDMKTRMAQQVADFAGKALVGMGCRDIPVELRAAFSSKILDVFTDAAGTAVYENVLGDLADAVKASDAASNAANTAAAGAAEAGAYDTGADAASNAGAGGAGGAAE